MQQSTFKRRVYNVGTGVNYTINDIAEMIAGKEAKTVRLPDRPAEVRETLADIKETIEDLGWSPKTRLEDVIKAY
jgi:nucleoside-diphosphate-sugar epimerase